MATPTRELTKGTGRKVRCRNPAIKLGAAGMGEVSRRGRGAVEPAAERVPVLAEEFDLRTAVVLNEKNILTVVPALNKRCAVTRNDVSGHPRHAANPLLAGREVNE